MSHGAQIRQSLPLSLLTRIEVHSGISDHEFIELSATSTASTADSRLAYEVAGAAARTEIVGTLYLFCQCVLTTSHSH